MRIYADLDGNEYIEVDILSGRGPSIFDGEELP